MGDAPIRAFITNLGKYGEGDLVGEWMDFPTTPEQLQNVFTRIGIDGKRYEEWFITDYESGIKRLVKRMGEHESLDELNYLASLLDEMDEGGLDVFAAAVEYGEHTGSLQDLINLAQNLDCYDFYPDIADEDDLGRYLIEELGAMEVPDHLVHYIDYEAYGRDVSIENGGAFVRDGYIMCGHGFAEYYDGKDIPEEYRLQPRRRPEPEFPRKPKRRKQNKRRGAAR